MFLSTALLLVVFGVVPVNVFNIPPDFTGSVITVIIVDSLPTAVFLIGVVILAFAQFKQWLEGTEEE
jgi:hypothetical protein